MKKLISAENQEEVNEIGIFFNLEEEDGDMKLAK